MIAECLLPFVFVGKPPQLVPNKWPVWPVWPVSGIRLASRPPRKRPYHLLMAKTEEQISHGRLLTDREAAIVLRMKESTLRKWRLIQRGPVFIKLPTGGVRYPAERLEEFIRAGKLGGGLEAGSQQ